MYLNRLTPPRCKTPLPPSRCILQPTFTQNFSSSPPHSLSVYGFSLMLVLLVRVKDPHPSSLLFNPLFSVTLFTSELPFPGVLICSYPRFFLSTPPSCALNSLPFTPVGFDLRGEPPPPPLPSYRNLETPHQTFDFNSSSSVDSLDPHLSPFRLPSPLPTPQQNCDTDLPPSCAAGPQFSNLPYCFPPLLRGLCLFILLAFTACPLFP